MPGMRRKRYVHMTFFWGKKSEILFTGWPGADGGMYALALVAAGRAPPRRVGGGDGQAAHAAVHELRTGGAYLLMLALMSFHGGVLLAAVAGHAAGFLAFKAGLFGDGRARVEDGCGKEELAPAAC
ncbi:copper transporter 3-like [Panicum hallii]|uniref:copper transporter 3-like n=1 Tax=Panicum hallii TaxID=206008 RepID=UPI000DF4CED5|nr:copper transporter 3-like [Panicum hallii]